MQAEELQKERGLISLLKIRSCAPSSDTQQFLKDINSDAAYRNQLACNTNNRSLFSVGEQFSDLSKEIHIGEKPYSCRDYEKSFSHSESLDTRQATRVKERSYSCRECGRSYIYLGGLMRHQRMGEKQYSCEECGRSFKNVSNLINHQRTHTGEKPYRCTDCGKSFSNSTILIRHQRIHTGEKPYRCTDCGKSFSLSTTLIIHQRIHTGEKPYSCRECGRSFSQRGNLYSHQRIHTREKPYSCREYGKTFNRSEILTGPVNTQERSHICIGHVEKASASWDPWLLIGKCTQERGHGDVRNLGRSTEHTGD